MLWAAHWQLDCARRKQAEAARLQAWRRAAPLILPPRRIDAKAYADHEVEATGRFVPQDSIYLDNQIQRGRAGYDILTPMRIGAGPLYVLVNRGWVRAPSLRANLPPVPPEPGTLTIVGIAAVPSKRFLQLSSQTVQGRVWENLELDRYAKTVPFPLDPVVILQQNDTGDGLARRWPRASAGERENLGYAFQWLVLAGSVLVVYGVTNTRRLTD
ncbi:MAG: SURF1 family protein [Betaproteobacteria bacterium]|nr:SURF1 family protein [Betaproteobacteria bacterium]